MPFPWCVAVHGIEKAIISWLISWILRFNPDLISSPVEGAPVDTSKNHVSELSTQSGGSV